MNMPRSLSLLTALLLSLPAAQAQTTTPTGTVTAAATAGAARAGTFKQVQGEAWVGTNIRSTPQPGDGLHEAERLSTGGSGSATIVLRDGTTLTVGPNSTVDLRRFQFDATTHQGNFLLDLLQGSVRVVTGLLAKANPDLFKVQTPTSVVGVRGTDFIVEAEAGR